MGRGAGGGGWPTQLSRIDRPAHPQINDFQTATNVPRHAHANVHRHAHVPSACGLAQLPPRCSRSPAAPTEAAEGALGRAAGEVEHWREPSACQHEVMQRLRRHGADGQAAWPRRSHEQGVGRVLARRSIDLREQYPRGFAQQRPPKGQQCQCARSACACRPRRVLRLRNLCGCGPAVTAFGTPSAAVRGARRKAAQQPYHRARMSQA
jgi:hypothetical protein